MGETTTIVLTSDEQFFSNSIARRFFENLEVASDSYFENGTISDDIISKIVGTPCMEPSELSELISNIELKLKNYAIMKRRS